MMTVVVAATLDAALGEPPVRLHPVVWMGRYLQVVGRRLPSGPPGRAVVLGGLAWAAGGLASVAAGVACQSVAARAGRLPHALLAGAVLWTAGSGRMLLREVALVEQALGEGLPQGRRALARIVSRDTSTLDAAQVRESALESLSENLADSVVAPLFWHAVGGLPAAVGYRFVNTADAVWGYRDERWLHAGRVAARADDLANVVPARLTALLLLGPDHAAWARLRVEAARTPSPNGGWPMGALALRLGARLTKPGAYQLNPQAREPASEDTARALRRCRNVAVLAAAVTALARAPAPSPGRRRRPPAIPHRSPVTPGGEP